MTTGGTGAQAEAGATAGAPDLAAEVEGLPWEMELTKEARDLWAALPGELCGALLATLRQLAAGNWDKATTRDVRRHFLGGEDGKGEPDPRLAREWPTWGAGVRGDS